MCPGSEGVNIDKKTSHRGVSSSQWEESHLELSERETAAGANPPVVPDGGAPHDGPQLVDGPGSDGCSLGLASMTARDLLAGLWGERTNISITETKPYNLPLCRQVQLHSSFHTWSKWHLTRRCQSLRKSETVSHSCPPVEPYMRRHVRRCVRRFRMGVGIFWLTVLLDLLVVLDRLD